MMDDTEPLHVFSLPLPLLVGSTLSTAAADFTVTSCESDSRRQGYWLVGLEAERMYAHTIDGKRL